MKSRFYSITFPLLFLGIFWIQILFIPSLWLGIPLATISFLWLAHQLRFHISRLFETPTPWWQALFLLLSLYLTLGSVAYYLFSIPRLFFPVLISIFTLLPLLSRKQPPPLPSRALLALLRVKRTLTPPILFASTLIFFFLFFLFRFLQTHQITSALRTPWDRIPPAVLLLFFFATFLGSVLFYRGKEKTISLIVSMMLLGVFCSFLPIVYPIGYGFDPFIHKATEQHLFQYGTITPKPFYYIGQYALVLLFSHGFSVPVDFVDTWLVPLLTIVLLPLAWFTSAKLLVHKPRYALLSLLGLFLLPIESFTLTTPQNLANLWTLLTILFCIPFFLEQARVTPPLFLVAIATALIHPIAGIPILCFLFLLALADQKILSARTTNIFHWIIVFCASLALPASFIAQSLQQGNGIRLNTHAFNPLAWIDSMHLDVFWQNRFSPLIDFVYAYGQNVFLLILLCSVGIWAVYRKDLSARFSLLFSMLLILGINYLLLANVIDFSFLIDYERANYANRLIPLMVFFLSPFILLAFGHLSLNLRTKPLILKVTALFLLSAVITSSLYLAFPRRDAYVLSRSFNVSQSDVEAVREIETWAQGEPYLALANQSVSAAAIKLIGFDYVGNQFLYPIPTGTPFYQFFLDMNASPSREIMEQARDLVMRNACDLDDCRSINTIFYVVNTYWWDADLIIEQAKVIADDWKSINGDVYVFRFDIKKQ